MNRWSGTVLLVFVVLTLLVPTLSYAQTGQPTDYAVTFTEKGLPNGTLWSISVAGSAEFSNNSTIIFRESNGSYHFIIGAVKNYRPLPNNFTVDVKGNNVSLVVIWVPVLYPVTFVESGLPADTFWNVTLGNETDYSSNSTITFEVMNGTYEYSIPNVNGIASSVSNGTIRVNGESTKVFVRFAIPVNFTFLEQGLPSGSKWSIFINGAYHNSTYPIISVTLPNGTYSFAVMLPSGYYASPSSGEVSSAKSLEIIKASSPLIYEIIISILVVMIGLFVFFYYRNIRKIKHAVNDGDKGEKK